MTETTLVVQQNQQFTGNQQMRPGGQVYIDGGNEPLTNFVFENCTFYRPGKPSLIMGKQVAPILFKHVTANGAVIKNAEELTQAGFDLSVPTKFEP